jgi:hypothetical protein
MISGMLVAAPASQASPSILVGQCIEFDTCYSSQTETPWSYDLSGAQLTSLGLGDSTSLIVGQTSQYIIRIGVTTITFDTPGGPVTDTLPELNGAGSFNGPCSSCYFEVDTIGDFTIPGDATSATIDGFFGNSTVANTAAVCVYAGSLGQCNANGITFGAVPEPVTLSVFGVGLVGAAAARRRRKRAKA